MQKSKRFIVATPFRSVCDNLARVLAKNELLRGYFVGTRRGTIGIPEELTHLAPVFGLWMMATRKVFTPYQAEWLRSAIHPIYDRWVRRHLKPGDCVISSYGYANRCFQWARVHGGETFLDAGNSHPAQFWEIVSEEHKKWGIRRPPYPPHWNARGKRIVKDTDYVISPSSYVGESFGKRGFPVDRVLNLPYPVDLSVFHPASLVPSRPSASTPLRVICTGSISLRKGTPYLLEAMRLICRRRKAVLVLVDLVESSMTNILPRYKDVPIQWEKPRSNEEIPALLGSCDIFALLSLEEGMARTAVEAMACSLPVVLTHNTGSSDFVRPGINGEIVPICDPEAAAAAILKCHDRLSLHGRPPMADLRNQLSFETFEKSFLAHLTRLRMT